MEILCEVGDPSRMMASMSRLLRHSNAYMRSKAVIVVGRGSKSAKWARQRLNETDPRIRANAIEALWSVDTDEAKVVLRFAPRTVTIASLPTRCSDYITWERVPCSRYVEHGRDESTLFRASAPG